MADETVRTSMIVRVVEGRDGCRIVLHDLRSRQVREFKTWEAALRHVRSVAERRGLR